MPVAVSSPFSVAQFQALARLRGPTGPRCDLCAAPLSAPHDHLLSPGRTVVCACAACGLLLGAAAGRYRKLPTRVLRLGPNAITPEDWAALAIPIGVAFLFRRDNGAGAAIYPGPAGVIEAELDAAVWVRLAASCPPIAAMAPEVEGVLAQRMAPRPELPYPPPPRHYVAPRDRCLALAAILRREWRGFGGGDGAWRALDQCFAALDREAVDLTAQCRTAVELAGAGREPPHA